MVDETSSGDCGCPPPEIDGALRSVPRIEPDVPATVAIRFEELSRGKREVQITLGADIYRLRLTRNHKLILTK